jgi:hypothetical protein
MIWDDRDEAIEAFKVCAPVLVSVLASATCSFRFFPVFTPHACYLLYMQAAHIHRAIVQTETTEQEMRGWLVTLLLHAYSELENKPKSEGDTTTPTDAEGTASAPDATGGAEQQPLAAESSGDQADVGETLANVGSQAGEGEASAAATGAAVTGVAATGVAASDMGVAASDMDVEADGDVREAKA